MAQTKQIVRSLRKLLKQNDMTYKDLASKIKVSEVTVKRLLTGENLSLKRLETIGAALGMTIQEIADFSFSDVESSTNRFSIEQEKELAKDPKLLALFYILTCNTPA